MFFRFWRSIIDLHDVFFERELLELKGRNLVSKASEDNCDYSTVLFERSKHPHCVQDLRGYVRAGCCIRVLVTNRTRNKDGTNIALAHRPPRQPIN